MVTQFDDKGKIFTQVIAKKPVQVVIQTVRHVIRGTVHVRATERVIDELNLSGQFIAVTDANVLDDQGNPIYTCDFVTLNKEQIIWIIPDDEIHQDLG